MPSKCPPTACGSRAQLYSVLLASYNQGKKCVLIIFHPLRLMVNLDLRGIPDDGLHLSLYISRPEAVNEVKGPKLATVVELLEVTSNGVTNFLMITITYPSLSGLSVARSAMHHSDF